jgi:hypothetical protein
MAIIGAALLVVCGSLLVLASGAGAQTAPAQTGPTVAVCPDGPATGTTGEDAVHELRELRREAAQTCAVLRDRLAAVADRSDLASKAVQDSVVVSRNEQVGRDAENPAYVRPAGTTGASGATGASDAQEVTLSAASRGFLDGNGEAMRSDLWFAVGLLSFAPFGFFFLRIVLP